MAESQRRSIFGNHDIRFFNLSDWTSTAYYRITGDVTLDFPAEFAELKGGSNLFTWDSAITSFNPTLSIVARELSADIISTNLASTVTEYSADSAGDVIDEANVYGSSIIDAAEGIATITVTPSTGAAELKEGWYMIKATGAATVDVYALSSSYKKIAPLRSDTHRKPLELGGNPERIIPNEALKKERVTTIRKEYRQASGSGGQLNRVDDMVYSLWEHKAA